MNKITFLFVITSVVSLQILSAQVCVSSISETAPASEFTANDDGTVRHDKTGLTWMRCSLGQTWTAGNCVGAASIYTWQEALQTVESEALPEGDWRLPNIKELQSIVEFSCESPAINQSTFPNTPVIKPEATAWSSSPNSDASDEAWYLYFNSGKNNNADKDKEYSVRLVRQPQLIQRGKQKLLSSNVRAFDDMRDLLQEEVKLDMVNKTKLNGRECEGTFSMVKNAIDHAL